MDEDKKFAYVAQKFAPQSKLLRAWELQGGVSAQVMALEIERVGGQTQKMVIRVHGTVDLTNNPQIAADEFKLLQLLQSAGVAAPQPYYLDQSCEIFPTPYIVIEYIEGKTEFSPAHLSDFILQFATHLSNIHRVDGRKWDVSFLPEQARIYAKKVGKRPAKTDESLDEGHIRDVLEAAGPLPQRNPSVLLHGDFWPGNILWQDGQLVAVIDWEDATSGDPLADVANSRLEILWAFGREAMEDFTRQYRAMTTIDFTNLPYWDLYAALRPAFRISEWAANEAIEKIWRAEHRWFTTQALAALT